MSTTAIKIKIEAYSWIAGSLGLSEQGTAKTVKTAEKGKTLSEFFAALAAGYPQFGQQVYNPAAGQLDSRVIVILNKRMVRSSDFAGTVLQEGDVVSLTPIISGG